MMTMQEAKELQSTKTGEQVALKWSRTNKFGLGALSFGHMVVDMQTSSLAVLIPLLYLSLRLDYATAALIITVNSLTSSVIQPLFGLISDRRSLRWLMPVGCLVAALGMILVLFMPSYWLVLLVVVISGLGAAAYHPEGTRNANYVSGENKAAGFSFFLIGGNIGYALGPICMAALIGVFGRNGTFGMMLPAFIGFVLLWYLIPFYTRYDPKQVQRAGTQKASADTSTASKRNIVLVMALLIAIICLRAMIQTGLITFIPLYFASLPGHNRAYAALLLSVFAFATSLGTLLGGPLADRLNRKVFMVGSLVLVTPSLLIFLHSNGLLQMIALGAAGATLIAALSVPVVMAQELLPNNVGLASGLTLGLAFGAGGLGTALIGTYADHFGLPKAMLALALLPILTVVLSLIVPMGKSKRV